MVIAKQFLLSLPQGSNGSGYIDIDVYYFDSETDKRWKEESPYGNIRNEYGDVFFNDYWWSEGNMGCDCNRGKDACNSGPNVVIIEKITPRGMPGVVLYAETLGDKF